MAVEQDSLDEIAGCVETVLRYEPGDFDPNPAFGTPEQVFLQGGANPDAVLSAISRWEPRADVAVAENPSLLSGLIDQIRVDVTGTPSED